MPTYPTDGAALIRPTRYKPEVLAAVRRLRRARPFRGTDAERRAKFAACLADLSRAYGIQCKLAPRLHWCAVYSVVTFLHEFAHAAFGPSERKACAWSLNLFARLAVQVDRAGHGRRPAAGGPGPAARRVFPRQFARCTFDGHMLVVDRGAPVRIR